jgi:hypothetical protein
MGLLLLDQFLDEQWPSARALERLHQDNTTVFGAITDTTWEKGNGPAYLLYEIGLRVPMIWCPAKRNQRASRSVARYVTHAGGILHLPPAR